MQPKILISGICGNRENYERAIALAGGVPHSCYCPSFDDSFDALVLAGGGDMDPALFSQPNRGSRNIDRDRDRCELALFRRFYRAGKPVLAICRGHQLVNVALGGTLIQDIPAHLQAIHAPANGDTLHPIETAPDSLLRTLLGHSPTVVSAHHQAVGHPGAGLRPTAHCSRTIEGMEHEHLPILCVQFHPERMCGSWAGPDRTDATPLFSYFLSLCK